MLKLEIPCRIASFLININSGYTEPVTRTVKYVNDLELLVRQKRYYRA